MNTGTYTPPKKILFTLILFIGLICSGQETKLDSILSDFTDRPDRVLIAAHRATNDHYPENSLEAITESIRIGIDIIEIDIRQSKDGELVIMHDKTIDRTTNGEGKVDDHTLSELKGYNLIFNEQVTPYKIPTFEEVLQLAKGKILLDIDFKLEDIDSIKKTYALIEKYGMENQILFFLYDYKETPKLQQLNPKIRVMPRAYSKKDVKAILKMDHIYVIHVDESYYKPGIMRKIMRSGARVWMNALGKYDTMEGQQKNTGFDALMSRKHINVIQTDLPEDLLNYLRARQLHR